MPHPPPADDADEAWCRFAAEASETLQAGGTLPGPVPDSFQTVPVLLHALRDARQHEPRPTGPALRPGGRLGRFELVRQAGRGGAGVVFEARDPALQRLVALKVLHPALAGHPRWRERFAAEGPALARLRHAHVVQVHEAGEIDGVCYLAMELVRGPNLHATLAAGPLPPPAAAALAVQLADAVAHAHAAGLLHRDLKPQNVLVDDRDGPKIIDFGLAAPLADGHLGVTVSGEFVGTPNYLAPEALHGVAGPAADVYGLGTVLYECLTGRPPFVASNVALTLAQVKAVDPVPPRAVNPEVPRDLETVCLTCLAKSPGKRYADVAALAADLRAVVAGRPIRARPPGVGERAAKWVRRRPTAAALLAALAVAVLTGLGGWWEHTRQLAATLERVRTEQAATAAALALADKRAGQLGRSNDALLGVFDDLNLERYRQQKVSVERALADRLAAVAGRLDGDAVGGPAATAELQARLGNALRSLGFADQALPLQTAAHDVVLAANGPDDAQRLLMAKNLGRTLDMLGRHAEAVALLEEVARRREATLGPDDPRTLAALQDLVSFRVKAGQDVNVVPLREELAARFARSDPDSPAAVSAAYNLGLAYLNHDQPRKAIAALEPVIARQKAKGVTDAPQMLSVIGYLGRAYLRVGQPDKAIALMADARARLLPAFGASHSRVVPLALELADAYQAAGRPEAAKALLAETADAVARHRNRDPGAWNALVRAANAYDAAGEPARTEVWRAALVEFAKARDGDGSQAHFGTLLDSGRNLLEQNKWAEAEPVLVRAHEVATKLSDADLQAKAAAELARLYEGWGRPADAAKWAAPQRP